MTNFSKPLALGSVSTLVLGVLLFVVPALASGLITGFVVAFWHDIDLLLWVNLATNFWWLNLVPKVVGFCLVAVVLARFVRSKYQVDTSKIKRQFVKVSVFGVLFALFLGLVFVVDLPVARAEATATTGYILDTPVSEFDWLIGYYSDGNCYAINGSNWDNLVAGVGSTAWGAYMDNATKIQELVLSSVTYGTVLLKEVPFNYSLTIPEDVTVVERVNGLDRVFINSADAQGDSYTVSVDTVYSDYYLVQDSANRFIASWSSINASLTISSAINATVIGDVYVKSGFYPLDPITVRTSTKGATADFTAYIALPMKSNVNLVGEKGAHLQSNGNINSTIIFLPPGTCNVTVSGFTMNTNASSVQMNTYMVLANGESGNEIRNNVIKDNFFYNSFNGVLLVNYCYYNLIADNYFYGTGYSMHTYSSVSTGKCGYNTYSRNTVVGSIEGVNIEHTGAYADSVLDNTITNTTYSGIVIQVSAALVKGNHVTLAGTGATTSYTNQSAGIWLRYYPNNTIVTGNYIENSYCQAILVSQGGKSISITNNYISGANLELYFKADGSAYSAIEVYDSASYPFINGLIANNEIRSLYQKYQVRANALYGYNNTLCNNVLPVGDSGKSVYLDSHWDVYGNSLYNPVGYIALPIDGNTFNLIDSGTNSTFVNSTIYTNTQSIKQLYIYGGNVLDIQKNGYSIGITNTTLLLYPKDTFNVTYSVAPTFLCFGE